MSKFTILPLSVFLCLLFLCTETASLSPLLIKRDQRTTIVATEFGDISTVVIGDECGGPYHIHFIKLEPNALLIPVILHSDMVFFVHTGSGIMNWIDEDKERTLELKPGDIYRLRSGTVFYLQNTLDKKLRVYAIFDKDCVQEPCLGPYSSINELLLGFDERILQSAFAVPEEVLWTLRNSKKPKLITSVQLRNGSQGPGEPGFRDRDKTWQSRFLGFVGGEDVTADHLEMEPVFNGGNKDSSAYNVFEAKPDFENDYGKSKTVEKKDLDVLKGSNFGVFLVNLTKGSMVGPHWNPRACEISIVLQGPGMVRVVTPPKSKNEKFIVEEGDVFVVPKFHPMAQMSFQNRSFVFTGFSTSVKANYPQFLVGQSSVLEVLDKEILEIAFNVNNETMESLLKGQKESVMLGCVGCAEKELENVRREIEEEKRRKEEEEAKKREKEKEAEEAREREEERKREEEERRRREKEAEEAREREEERKKEEEIAKRQEEERRRREKEAEEAREREEERRREEEEAKRQEEERRRREKEAEEAREREEEEAKRQEEERRRREREAEEAREREEERKKEEEEAKRREEERERKEREEVEKRKREEQERERREEERKREEEEARREEEERKRREEEEKRRTPPQPYPQPQPPPSTAEES